MFSLSVNDNPTHWRLRLAQYLEAAKHACASLFSIIDRRPVIPANAPGLTLQEVTSRFKWNCLIMLTPHAYVDLWDIMQLKGDIEFKNVAFSYPSRKDRFIFRNFDLTIPAGKHALQPGRSA